MSYLVLARKYRPRNFTEMVGQDHVVQALSNALTTQRLHHAYLFTGTRGVGKTTVVNTILGLAHLKAGNVSMGGAPVSKPRTYMAAQKGIAVVPQGRCIIANLTVEENLTLGAAVGRKGPWNVPEIYKLFPILQERAHTPGTAL